MDPGSGLAVVPVLPGAGRATENGVGTIPWAWTFFDAPKKKMKYLYKEFFHVHSRIWVRGNLKMSLLSLPWSIHGSLWWMMICHCFSLWWWNWIPFYWLAAAVGDGSFLMFLYPFCGQCKCYWTKFISGYPELLINFSLPSPGVCTYLIWTVFISSGPDACGQLFTMRSLLDI